MRTPLIRQIGSRLTALILCMALVYSLTSTTASGQSVKPITQLPAGTYVNLNDPATAKTEPWSRMILLAKPKISSGDVDSLSATVRDAATKLSLTILATVAPHKDGPGFFLREVGVGFSVPIKGRPRIITSATQSQLGADLGFIQRRVLGNNEAQLGQLSSIVHTTTLMMFDAPAIMHRNNAHRDYITRHLIWIDPKTGVGSTLVWLLGKDASGRLRPAKEPLRLLKHGVTERRGIHVDGNEFSFGIPSERAFALEQLPPGKDIQWTNELAATAALRNYSAAALVKLSEAMNNAMNLK